MGKLYRAICGKYRKLEKPKISYILGKTLIISFFAVSPRMNMKRYLKKKIRLRLQKFLV